MKTSLTVAVLCALGLLVAVSCTTATRSQGSATETTATPEKVEFTPRQGMSSSEVRAAWGPPRDVQQDPGAPGTETWVYERSKIVTTGGTPVVQHVQYRLTIVNGSLTRIDERPL